MQFDRKGLHNLTGLDVILNDINRETDSIVAKIELEAKEKADEIIKKGEFDADKKLSEIKASIESKKQENFRRCQSADDLEKRKRILIAKQEIISNVIAKAKNKLVNADDKEYFDNIVKMVEKYASSQKGEIIFNERDLKRLPKDLQKRIDNVINKKGGSLKISVQTRDIDDGFILSYGNIEANCSFTALFNSADNELKDLVHNLFFS